MSRNDSPIQIFEKKLSGSIKQGYTLKETREKWGYLERNEGS